MNKRMNSHAKKKNKGIKSPKTHPTKAKRMPTRRKKPRGTPSVYLLGIGGLALIANGLAITIGPKYLPELTEWARLMDRAQVPGAVHCLTGAVLVGLAIVARCIRVHTASLLEPTQAEFTLEEVVADLAEFKNQVHDLQNDNIECLESIGVVKREVMDHREEFRSNQPKDALFRLAASLDQLGARVDQRIGEATSVLQEGSYEVSSLVEASREYLQETLEDLLGKVTRISESTESYSGSPEPDEHYEEAPEESETTLRLSTPSEDTPEPEYVDQALEVASEPAQAEVTEAPGLGFLDSIDDSGQGNPVTEPGFHQVQEQDPMGGPPSALPSDAQHLQDQTEPPYGRPA